MNQFKDRKGAQQQKKIMKSGFGTFSKSSPQFVDQLECVASYVYQWNLTLEPTIWDLVRVCIVLDHMFQSMNSVSKLRYTYHNKPTTT